MSLLHDLRNLFQKDKQPPVTKAEAKAEIPASVIPNPPHEVIPDQAKPAPAGGTIVCQVVASQPSPPEILAQIDWAVKNAKTYRTGDLIENRYKVEEVMSGAMGYVYIGRDARQQITFAIKQPKESMLADRDLFSRVLQEADSWTGLGMHPNIAYCYFVKQIEEVPHIFIEYVDGGSLEEWISDRRCADYKVGLDMAIQFCHGLERAHDRGMIHRDIKPRNILVTKEGLVKVTDFGIAGGIKVGGKGGAISGDQQGTRMGAMMGTQAYMSPEQFRDPRQKSAEAPEGVWYESDVYSFGVCLWEMFCGRRPREISIGITGDTPDPQRLRRDIPAGLRTLLLSSVDLDREKRPQDFSELREKLNGIYRYLYGSDAPHYQLELHDTTADERNNQGYSYYELGKKEEARRCFEAAVEVNNTHLEAVFNLALLRWRGGEIDDLEVLIRIRNLLNNPAVSKEKIAELLAFFHVERYDLESAKEELKEYAGKYEELFGLSMTGSIRLIRTIEVHICYGFSVSLSADWRYVLLGSRDNTLKLWEMSTGQCLRTFLGHTAYVASVSLSADGRYALSGSWDNTIKLWSVSKGQCLRIFIGHTAYVASVSLSADGRYALSGSHDKTLKLWDVNTGQCMRTFKGHSEWVTSVSLSADGKSALSGSADNTFKLWDIKSGQCMRTFEGHRGAVNSMSLSADGSYVLSGSFDDTLKLWDVNTGQCMRTFVGHRDEVNSVCLSADGKYALSGSRDKTLKLWEMSTGQCLRTFEGHRGGVNSVCLSADGKYALFGSSDGTLKLWEINIKAHSYKSEIQVSDFRAFEEIKGVQDELKLAIQEAVRFMNNGNNAQAYTELYSAWERDDFRDDKELLTVYQKLYELSSRKSFSFAYEKNSFISGAVRSVSLSADGKYALSGSYGDDTPKLWNVSTGQCIRTFEGHSDSVTSVSLSADGKYALSGSRDNTLKLWDIKSGLCMRTFTGHYNQVQSVCLSADERYALSGSWDNMLKLWDVSTGQCLRTFAGHSGLVRYVSFSADGRYALSGSYDKTLKLWDVSTGQCLRTMEGHSDSVESVSLSADGTYGLSGSHDKTLKLWEMSTGQCLRTFEGHRDHVLSVNLSADGKYAISGSKDKMLKLWEVSTGSCLRTFEGYSNVTSVSLSADGSFAISGSYEGTIKLWRLIWKLEFD
jgi:WD40 repeat protein/serine/threonine protein kinase